MSMPATTRARIWLNMLDKYTKPLMPIYPNDYHTLGKIIPLQAERVIKNNLGTPRVFMIDRLKTINLLKLQYNFKTKSEAIDELREIRE